MQIKIILSICFLSLASFAGSETYKMRWVLAHEPARVFERSAREFASKVAEASNGRLKVDIVMAKDLPGGAPLSPYKVFDKVAKGEFEMCQTYTTYLGSKDKDMWVLDLPYLFRDHQHAAKVLDGSIGKRILAGLDKTGVKGLAFTYSGGFRIIPTANKAIQKVEDFKGMKIKVADSPVAAEYLTALGAIPVLQVADSEYKKAGMDGFETTYARLEITPNNSKSKYINETEHSLFLTSILINKAYFDKLPADLQKIVTDSVLVTAQMEREESIKDGLDLKKKYQQMGMKVVNLDEKQTDRLKEIATKIKEKYNKFFGNNLVADIQNQ